MTNTELIHNLTYIIKENNLHLSEIRDIGEACKRLKAMDKPISFTQWLQQWIGA